MSMRERDTIIRLRAALRALIFEVREDQDIYRTPQLKAALTAAQEELDANPVPEWSAHENR